MPKTLCGVFVIVCVLAFGLLGNAVNPLDAGNWPQWRGPEGNGVSLETDLPVAWTEGSGIEWKCELPEWGTSTPAIRDNAVFVTSHVDDRRLLLLLRIDKRSGRIEWTRQVGTGTVLRAAGLSKSPQMRRQQEFHKTHNLASPSPAVSDGRIFIRGRKWLYCLQK